MSMKERRRLAALEQVRAGQLTLRAAAERLGLSERQAKRVYARFKAEGDAGLVHRLRGRAGNRLSDPAVRQRALELYQTHYGDFGPTLAAEYLAADHELTVKPGTLRRGWWRRGCGGVAGGGRSGVGGGSVGGASASWCSWMARRTTGSRDAASGAWRW